MKIVDSIKNKDLFSFKLLIDWLIEDKFSWGCNFVNKHLTNTHVK